MPRFRAWEMAHSGLDHELRAVEPVGIMRLISLTFAPLTFSSRAVARIPMTLVQRPSDTSLS
jgi:hypothetical protein